MTPTPAKHSLPFLIGLGLLLAPRLPAQPAAPPIPAISLLPVANPADPVGAELQAVQIAPAPDEMTASPDPVARGAARRKQAERFQRMAERARAFQEKYPDRPEAAQAKSMEARVLLSAAMAEDNSQADRTATLVAEVRADRRLAAKARLEVVALSEVVRLQPLMGDRKKFLAASEASARDLIAEFPQEPAGYEALFHLAESLPNETKGVALAQEVMAMPAPAPVKDQVRVFLDRQALVGQSLSGLADTALGADNPISAVRKTPIILYSWATWNPGSIAYARSLRTIAPTEAVLVGVNLDKDTAAARAAAQGESLPGSQVYDERGSDSPFALALKLAPAGHVYLTNARGEIRTVSAQREDLAERFAAPAH